MVVRRAQFVVLGLFLMLSFLALTTLPFNATSPGRFAMRIRGKFYAAVRAVGREKTIMTIRNWNTIAGADVSVSYEGNAMPEPGLPNSVLQTAEEASTLVARDLDMPAARHITVIVHADRDSLRQAFGWSASQSASGVYWGGVIRVLSPDVWLAGDNPEQVAQDFHDRGPLVHEITHLMLDYKTNGNYETWFTEGLAQWEEYKLIDWEWTDGEARLHTSPLPFSLLRSSFNQIKDEALAYRESFRMVQYIVNEVGQAGLNNIINRLADGYSTDAALQQVLHKTPVQFERDFNQWLQSQPM